MWHNKSIRKFMEYKIRMHESDGTFRIYDVPKGTPLLEVMSHAFNRAKEGNTCDVYQGTRMIATYYK